jgi:hypothetical protein
MITVSVNNLRNGAWLIHSAEPSGNGSDLSVAERGYKFVNLATETSIQLLILLIALSVSSNLRGDPLNDDLQV